MKSFGIWWNVSKIELFWSKFWRIAPMPFHLVLIVGQTVTAGKGTSRIPLRLTKRKTVFKIHYSTLRIRNQNTEYWKHLKNWTYSFWNGMPFPCNGLMLCCVNIPTVLLMFFNKFASCSFYFFCGRPSFGLKQLGIVHLYCVTSSFARKYNPKNISLYNFTINKYI